MYKYGTLLIIASALSAMEQPSEGKQEVSFTPSTQALSFDSLKKVLLPKNASSEERHRAAACAAYLSKYGAKEAWFQFGESWGQLVPGMDDLAVFSTSEKRLHEPLVRAAHADVAIFLDALWGSKLFIGTGFGGNVKTMGYLPRDIEVSFTDAHIPRISPDGKWVLCWGNGNGVYLIPTDGFSTEKELSPIVGTEGLKSSFCDFCFINDSEFVFYDGQSVFRGFASEVSQHGVSKLSKIIDCGRLDQNIFTQNNSVLHVFGGGALLAFKHTGSTISKKRGITIYDLANDTVSVFKSISLPKAKSLSAVYTTLDATSLVLKYVDESADFVWIDTDLKMKGVSPQVKVTDCIYSPDGGHVLLFDKAHSSIALSTVLGGAYKQQMLSLADVAPDFLRWDKSGISYTNIIARDSGIICWNRLPALLSQYKKTVTGSDAEAPSKRKMIGGSESDAKVLKS